MKTQYSFIYKSIFSLFLICISANGIAQTSKFIKRVVPDSSKAELNMDAVYNRPFLQVGKTSAALGGYLETNSIYSSVDGVSEGLSFQARRLTLFMSASIAKRISFLSEMEFEDGTKEIGIEFAAIDVNLHPLLNFRGGIVMNPIGGFNQNHDGPKWEFIERPDVAVNMLPATWSNAGFGIFGKTYLGNWVFGYEAYLTNGFNSSIIDNEENKTFLPAAKEDEERFEESASGRPLTSIKFAIKRRNIGEIGLSYMGGVYNTFAPDGLELDEARSLKVFAIDYNFSSKRAGTTIIGELVTLNVELPENYAPNYSNSQVGWFLDVIQPLYRGTILDWKKASFNLAMRIDNVDWNRMESSSRVGFETISGDTFGEEIFAITPAISLRPSPQTVFRLNYRRSWQTDILNNPAAIGGSWLFGFSTYF